MIYAAILLPALVCAIAAIWLRGPLRRASWTTWLGHMLIGAGVPVLMGQGAALLVLQGDTPETAPLLLAAGLSGGLGWAAGAFSVRLTGSKPED